MGCYVCRTRYRDMGLIELIECVNTRDVQGVFKYIRENRLLQDVERAGGARYPGQYPLQYYPFEPYELLKQGMRECRLLTVSTSLLECLKWLNDEMKLGIVFSSADMSLHDSMCSLYELSGAMNDCSRKEAYYKDCVVLSIKKIETRILWVISEVLWFWAKQDMEESLELQHIGT